LNTATCMAMWLKTAAMGCWSGCSPGSSHRFQWTDPSHHLKRGTQGNRMIDDGHKKAGTRAIQPTRILPPRDWVQPRTKKPARSPAREVPKGTGHPVFRRRHQPGNLERQGQPANAQKPAAKGCCDQEYAISTAPTRPKPIVPD